MVLYITSVWACWMVWQIKWMENTFWYLCRIHTSLHGENSSSKLHRTDEETLIISSEVLVFSAVMTGCQIFTSWNVVLNCWTDLDKLRRHCNAAACSGTFSFWLMAWWMLSISLEQLSTIWLKRKGRIHYSLLCIIRYSPVSITQTPRG